jgi:CelD/BcsL family acetyltransferase involved in cellulose biosynthesis
MAIQEINTDKDLEEIGPAWRSLLRDAATKTPFQTHEWASSWWAVYGKSHRLSVLVLRERDALMGIAPLVLRDYRVFRRLTLIGGHRADYSDFIVPRDRLRGYKELINHLGFSMRNYDELMLENIPEASPLLSALDEYSPRLVIRKQVLDVCPHLTLNQKTEEVLLKIEAKQSLRRKIRKLSEKGTLRFRHYSDSIEMEKAVVPLLEAYLGRFDRSNLKKRLPLEREFHIQLLRRMGPEQMVQFGVLELNDRAIAQHFGFGYDGVYYWVRPAFDHLYAEYSPGALLLCYLIESAWKGGFREFDFLRGKEPFKTNIAGQLRQVMMVKLYRSLPKYIICAAAAAINGRIQRRTFRQT